MNPTVQHVTERIVQRSIGLRQAYLARVQAHVERPRGPDRMGCANLAHGFAACGVADKAAMRDGDQPNLGIVTSYNDMLSAHQPLEHYPQVIREAVREIGARLIVRYLDAPETVKLRPLPTIPPGAPI